MLHDVIHDTDIYYGIISFRIFFSLPLFSTKLFVVVVSCEQQVQQDEKTREEKKRGKAMKLKLLDLHQHLLLFSFL